MAGLYVHLPFCKSRCIYCGFYSTTLLGMVDEYVESVCRELDLVDWKDCDISTIYFGGGTPSQLPVSAISRILSCIYNRYKVSPEAEVTLEGNPDDVTPQYLLDLRKIGINRLSMGVQTFNDSRLRFLNRRHSSEQAIRAVKNAQVAGFDNISMDLMFGFPGQTQEEWKQDIDVALSLGVQHLSAYSLMYEEGTHLCNLLEKGDIEEISDNDSLAMYEYLNDALEKAGFEHYEISNYAKPGFRSRHNSSYWQGIPYLGLGAGAHSYDGRQRWYNPDNLKKYIEAININDDVREYETLTQNEKYDEYVMTGLRTCDGVDITELKQLFGESYLDYCLENARRHIDSGRMTLDGNRMCLSRSGLFVSNDIMSDLMMSED